MIEKLIQVKMSTHLSHSEHNNTSKIILHNTLFLLNCSFSFYKQATISDGGHSSRRKDDNN